ncbi:MAG: T9SS type A sorting domain-containing protein, partial [Bacteroidetes bacterium]|nr:T9SS type A sorting domain-containing protein [Bacteroidota bacterium]
NPASNLIHIELSLVDKTLHFTLHDIYGKQLMSFSIRPNNSVSTQQLDISKLAKGIYYLHISNFEYMKLTKFTKY